MILRRDQTPALQQRHQTTLNALVRDLLMKTVLADRGASVWEMFRLMDAHPGQLPRPALDPRGTPCPIEFSLTPTYWSARRMPEHKSRKIIARFAESDDGVISTQVVQEFFVAATHKLGVEPLVAKGVLKTFDVFEVVQVSTALIHEAIDCSILNELSFLDSLILAAAASAGCSTVLSEDLNPGQAILDVKVQNPFASLKPRSSYLRGLRVLCGSVFLKLNRKDLKGRKEKPQQN